VHIIVGIVGLLLVVALLCFWVILLGRSPATIRLHHASRVEKRTMTSDVLLTKKMIGGDCALSAAHGRHAAHGCTTRADALTSCNYVLKNG
jgi:hypothetical protein